MTIANNKGNSLAPQQDFVITSNFWVDKIQPEKWSLVSDCIKQEFTAEISEKNPFEIHIKSIFKEGKKYSLTFPKETVSSFYVSLLKTHCFDIDSVKTEAYGGMFTDIVVPEGYVFAMGDNRSVSADCRRFGCIPLEKIEGKVTIRFWPLNKFGTIKKAE